MNDGTTTETTGAVAAPPAEVVTPATPETSVILPSVPPSADNSGSSADALNAVPLVTAPAETTNPALSPEPTLAPEPTPPSFGAMTAPAEDSGSLGTGLGQSGSAPAATPTQSGGLPPPATPEAAPATTSTADTTVKKPWWHVW